VACHQPSCAPTLQELTHICNKKKQQQQQQQHCQKHTMMMIDTGTKLAPGSSSNTNINTNINSKLSLFQTLETLSLQNMALVASSIDVPMLGAAQ
jgi:hypothetical protein